MRELLLIETTYLGPISWFQLVINSQKIHIEQQEHFVKASYRNRCKIASPDGILTMSVPIRHGRDKKQKMKEIEIYNGNDIGWQKHHWQTLCSAYRRSPYFEYYEDELEVFYRKEYQLLMNFNQDLFTWVCEKLDAELTVEFTKEFHKTVEPPTEDYRSVLRPNANKDTRPDWLIHPTYHQVFEDRTGFLPDMSILDLLFAEGPNAISHLLMES